MYGFEGAKSEIGAVMGLNHERMKCKVIFDDFVEKVVTYLYFEFDRSKRCGEDDHRQG